MLSNNVALRAREGGGRFERHLLERRGIFLKFNEFNRFLLVRYPEIGSVRFDPEKKTLLFSFVLVDSFSETVFQAFKEQLLLSLDNISQFQGREPGQTLITYTEYDSLTFLEVIRDIDSLTHEDIAVIIGVAQQFFEGCLLLDQDDNIQEEDEMLQEEMIEHMLEDLKDSRPEKRLIGFREEGRVLVFNRANLHK